MITELKRIVEENELHVEDLDFIEGLIEAAIHDAEEEIKKKITDCLEKGDTERIKQLADVLEEVIELRKIEVDLDNESDSEGNYKGNTMDYPVELEINVWGLRATATLVSSRKLILKKGSQIKRETDLNYKKNIKLYTELVTPNNTRDIGDRLVLTEDIVIDNNSYPTRLGYIIVSGKEDSGINNWLVKGTGNTLRDYYNIGNLHEVNKPKYFKVFGETVNHESWHKTVIYILNKMIKDDKEAFERIKKWEYKKTFHIVTEDTLKQGEPYNELVLKNGEIITIWMGSGGIQKLIDKILKETSLKNNKINYVY